MLLQEIVSSACKLQETFLDTCDTCAALDMSSEKDAVELVNGIEELKRRLEKLLGAPSDAEIHQAQKEEVARQVRSRRERVALAGEQHLTVAFSFIGEMLLEPETGE